MIVVSKNGGYTIIDTSWRTAVIERGGSMRLKDGSLHIVSDKEYAIPVSQLQNVIVESNEMSISTPLINDLVSNNVTLILCDDKHNPSCLVMPLSSQFETSGRLMDQCAWSDYNKNIVWRSIVQNKIANQISVLKKQGVHVNEKLIQYYDEVEPGDFTNREGQAARVYFNSLFGFTFVRHALDNTNAALNYGYSIIQSLFCRIITAHGYHTALGIKHCNRQNPFNLACDLMEPFRPFVDCIVAEHMDQPLTRAYKQELIEVLDKRTAYEGRSVSVRDAAELFSLKVFRELSSTEPYLKGVLFDQ